MLTRNKLTVVLRWLNKLTEKSKDRKIYATLGASNHVDHERQEEDYYATEPKAMELLLEQEQFSPTVWECACGGGHLSRVLESAGYNVISTDLVYRGYGETVPHDFLNDEPIHGFSGDIITNPPYSHALDFAKKALEIVPTGNRVAMFLRLQFLEGKQRKEFFAENPPKTVYVSSSRLRCAKNGEFDRYAISAMAFAWFVWEKGYTGDTVVKWIN